MLRNTWLAFCLSLFLPSAALACGKVELRALIEAAQTLSAQTEAKAAKLLTCPAEVPEAIQWLAFYRSASNTEKKPAQVIRAVAPRSQAAAAVNTDIIQAYLGSYTNLKAKFESADPAYRDEPLVSLALARALIRKREFSEGRSYYANYLRMVRGAYAEEVENIYSFIWEGRLDQAQHELASVDFAETPPEYARSITNGKELVQRLRLASANVGTDSPAMAEARFGLDLEGFTIKDEMQRISTGLRYHGPVDASWRHHLIKELTYDKATLGTDEFRIGAAHTLSGRVMLGAHIGYLTNSNQHYLGDAQLRLRIKNQLWLGGGAEREPMLTSTPLTSTALGLLRDRIYLEAGWPGLLTARSSYIRDHQLAAFERHEINLHQDLVTTDAGAEVFGISALTHYEARPQPSPNYDSYHTTIKLGVGAFAEHKLGLDWAAGTEVQYLLTQVQPFGTNTTERLSGGELKVHLSERIGDGWVIGAKLTYGVQETARPAQIIGQRLAVLGSLELLR